MLVYSNSFRVVGEKAEEVTNRAIHGWLKGKLKKPFSLSECLQAGEWSAGRGRDAVWLKSYVSDSGTPVLYAWRLKHADEKIPGRQWVVELGYKKSDDGIDFSCTVQTDEQSALVDTNVEPSKPRVVQYLLKNIDSEPLASLDTNTPGRKLKKVGFDRSEYQALLSAIEDERRDYPLVLVSPARDGEYLVNRQHLQEALVGLAQVVEVVSDFQSYEMEAVLGRKFSAWDGAVNIIHTPRKDGRIYQKLLKSRDIECLGDKQFQRVSAILGIVTHQTNVPRLRNRVRPEGVIQHALRQRLFAYRTIDKNKLGVEELRDENQQLWDELYRAENTISALEAERDNAELQRLEALEEKEQALQQVRKLKYKIKSIERSASRGGVAISQSVVETIRLLSSPSEPTAEECLEIIDDLFSDRCEILPSARESAEKYSMFAHGRRLLALMIKLMTEYYECFREGGDNLAKNVFTRDEYSATESESVTKNKEMVSCRTFYHDGKPIVMFRHLKIGKADDRRYLVRVYFEWNKERDKIIIGHCGEHLPIPSH